MITVLFCWIFVTLVAISFGDMLLKLYSNLLKRKEDSTLFELFIIGICFIGILISISSLWLPSNSLIACILLATSLLYIVFGLDKKLFWKKIQQAWGKTPKLHKLLIFLSCFIVALFSITPPQISDSFLYHIQNTMWNETYSVVPGLVNIIEQFGFNSNVFLLYSTFGFRDLFGQYVFSLNSLAMILLFIQIILNANKGLSLNKTIISLLAYILLTIGYSMYFGSFSTDVLPNILVTYLALVLINNPKDIRNKTLLFILIPLFCITLKASSVLIALFTLYLFIVAIKEKQYKLIYTILCIGTIIMLPWLVRNVIVSGYLIYPFYALDIFAVDWKLPYDETVLSSQVIKYNPIGAWDPIEDVMALSFGGKIKSWLNVQSALSVLFILASILSPCLLLIAYWKNKKVIQQNLHFIFIWLVFAIGFIFCTILAPSSRFYLGFIIGTMLIPIHLLGKSYFQEKSLLPTLRNSKNVAIVCTLVVTTLFTLRFVHYANNPNFFYTQRLFTPAGVEYVLEKHKQTTSVIQINNVEVHYAHFIDMLNIPGACFDCELPCLSVLNKNIEMRGQTLQDGFRSVK